jgi:hypothetical protein
MRSEIKIPIQELSYCFPQVSDFEPRSAILHFILKLGVEGHFAFLILNYSYSVTLTPSSGGIFDLALYHLW